MSAYIVCPLSWGSCDVLENTEPSMLGKTLVNLIREHGAEEASDVLSHGYCWEYLDENMKCYDDGDVEGYGKLLDGIFFDIGECDYIYGIMSDGTIQITRCEDDEKAFVDPDDEDSLDQIKELFQ